MEPNDTIALPVNDIIPPGVIDNWPPALGWWLLLCLFVFLLVTGWRYIKRYRQYWSYRKVALNELKLIVNNASSGNNNHTATAIMSILKRVSITTYQEHDFTKLEGHRFLSFANSVVPQAVFSQAIINNIDKVLYSQQQNIDINSLYKQSCQWVKQHPAQLPNITSAVNHV